jgi:hypothetical protein
MGVAVGQLGMGILRLRGPAVSIAAPHCDALQRLRSAAGKQATVEPMPARETRERTSEGRVPWSFRRVVDPAPPEPGDVDRAESPIDCFVLARLEKQGLLPGPPAGKQALLRRVTYDLTGLPPTPREIDDFIDDDSPAAFARVVERLLASPRYGERWARHWLDVVGFAETRSGENDAAYERAFEYRDYVIRALNDDLPFNEFLLEHLAGDLLDVPRRHPATQSNESIVATGIFHLLSERESPVDLDEEAANRVDQQVQLLSRAFLGVGIGCARCHDHKYDPITRDDYRWLAAHFRATLPSEAFVGPPAEGAVARLRAFDDENRSSVIDSLASDLKQRVKLLSSIWLSRHRDSQRAQGSARSPIDVSTLIGRRACLELVDPGDGFASLDAVYFAPTPALQKPANRFAESLLSQSAPRSIDDLASAYERLLLTCIDKWHSSAQGGAELGEDEIMLVNWLCSTDLLPPSEDGSKRSIAAASFAAEVARRRRAIEKELPPMHPVHALGAAPALDSRSSPAAHGAECHAPSAAFFSALSNKRDVPVNAAPDRLLLARALIDPATAPLVPRVIVNRIWQHHFGTGIVATPSEFGQMGAEPGDPALLDFLASRFVEGNWSIKSLQRLIALSSTYQTSCAGQESRAAGAPSAAAIIYRSPIRLEGEAIRDSLLAVSGRLDQAMYGPSVESQVCGGYGPHGPRKAITDAISNGGARRGIYLRVCRNSPPRSLAAFGLPSPSCLDGRRSSEFGAEQALALLNGDLVHRCALEWSRDLLSMGSPTLAALVQHVYRAALGREPDAAELALGTEFIAAQKRKYAVGSEQKAAADFCHVIFATSEFIWLR